MAGMKILLAGQDISQFVEESSLDIQDTLGQGAGVGGGSSGRATQCTLLTRLGPAMSAVGAGTVIDLTPLQTAVKADGPLVYLPFTDVVGSTTAADVSGNHSNGTAFGNPTFGASSIIPCSPYTALDVSNGGYISVPTTGLPTGSGVVTLEAWYYCAGAVASGNFWAAVVDLGDAATANDFSVLHGNGNHLWVGSWNNGVEVPNVFLPGHLYHIVAIHDAGQVYCYINNVLVASGADADTITAYKCYVGKLTDSTNAHSGSVAPLPGIVAHFAAYNAHLSGTRIAAHYSVGTAVYSPLLVRQGELQIYDSTGTCIFGGYATGYDDKTDKKTNYTEVECHDYWQALDRIVINEVFDGQTDVYMINYLLNKYATWIDKSILPTTASYTFGPENYQHFTLQKALQRIADKTGYSVWIDPTKKIHYINPLQASTAPFQLADRPDFSTSFSMGVNDVKIDDNSTINRVYFYGGKHLSADFTQDLSTQANGTNDIFTLSYYPHKAADGKFHLIIGGTDHTVIGISGGTTNADKLIKDGGTASYLLDIDAHVIYWNTAPAGGTSIQFKFRHEIPLVVVLTDANSYAYYGNYYDGVISDSSVFDTATAIKRCRTLLLEQSYGLTTLEVKCWKPGIQAGMILRVDHFVRAIHASYIVQEVHIYPKGAGFFEYVITLGSWNWNLVDIVSQLARNAAPDDTSSSEQTVPISVQPIAQNVGVHDVWTKQTRTMGNYLFRNAPVGDGQDGYFGLASFA